MRKIIQIGILIVLMSLGAFATSVPSWQKKSGWKDIEIYAKANGGTEKDMKAVTPRTLGAYWAGRVTKFYWSKSQNRVTKVKVRVTWSSPRGKPCGKVVIMPIDGYKDLNFRSPAMYKCK
jgi:hypothetical protein